MYWSQNQFHQTVTIEQNKNENLIVMKKHYESLKRKYNSIVSVNLMSKSKKQEEKLSETFSKLIKQIPLNLYYFHLEYHVIVKEGGQNLLNNYISKLFNEEALQYKKLYSIIKGNKITQQQNVLLRINCLDCLDRTNDF